MSFGQAQTLALAPGDATMSIASSTRLVRLLEWGALIYLLSISASAFGFVDVLVFGRTFEKTSESGFARALWPIAYLLFAFLIALNVRAVLASARLCWWVLPFPFLAVVSILWSIDPDATLDGAVRIAATTAMALWLGTRFSVGQLARATFWVLLVAVAVSVLAAAASLDFAFMRDGTVRGVFHHKNVLGSRAALLVVVAIAVFASRRQVAVALFGIAVGVAALVWSGSASGLVLCALAVLAAPVALSLRSHSFALALRFLAIGALACAGGFVLVALRIDPVSDGLAALGRDPTLTGRLLLWQAALHHIAERPLLGAGFSAFWDAGMDWRTFRVLDQLGYVLHFHNSFLEVGVQLGALGLLAALLMCVGYGRTAFLALRARIDPAAVWMALFGLTTLALAMVEYELFLKHNVFHILFIALPVAAAARMAWARAITPMWAGHESQAGRVASERFPDHSGSPAALLRAGARAEQAPDGALQP